MYLIFKCVFIGSSCSHLVYASTRRLGNTQHVSAFLEINPAPLTNPGISACRSCANEMQTANPHTTINNIDNNVWLNTRTTCNPFMCYGVCSSKHTLTHTFVHTLTHTHAFVQTFTLTHIRAPPSEHASRCNANLKQGNYSFGSDNVLHRRHQQLCS